MTAPAARVRGLVRAVLDRAARPAPPAAVSLPSTDRSYFLAAAEWRRRWSRPCCDELDLTAHELKVSAQNGEDGVIAEILRRVGLSERPFFVEFGIERGAEGNCVALADQLGWPGLFIEADAEQHRHLARKYRWGPVATTLARVTPESVERLLAEAGVPPGLDVLSMDIDGGEYWIWRALGTHRPRLVICELNAGLDPAHRLVVPRDYAGWDRSDWHGASLGALCHLAAAKGYRHVHTELTGNNAFFVREDLGGAWSPPPPRGPNHYLRSWSHPPDPQGRAYERDPPV